MAVPVCQRISTFHICCSRTPLPREQCRSSSLARSTSHTCPSSPIDPIELAHSHLDTHFSRPHLLVDFVAVFPRVAVALLGRFVVALLSRDGHARRDQLVDVHVLANVPRDLFALLRVDVLLDLLRLSVLLQGADFLVLVAAVFPGFHRRH